VALMVAIFAVQDVQTYRSYHQANEALRREHGCLGVRISQDVEDPKMVVLLLDFPSASQANAYLDAAIRRGAVEGSTLQGLPRVEVYDQPVRTGP
jgi:quinol monooxygenase YgiN